jgi:hypothetical protein
VLQEDDCEGRKGRYLLQKGGEQRRLLPSSNAVAKSGRGESRAHHLMVRDNMIVSLMDGTLGSCFAPHHPAYTRTSLLIGYPTRTLDRAVSSDVASEIPSDFELRHGNKAIDFHSLREILFDQ